eukprot:GHVS01022506.1.p1 GENE.GHVS01022506.1~~GHVS01022506.1.p1  ORF type:complete len:700 (-),score=172.35 GHVS01022506.1:204-2303(-)
MQRHPSSTNSSQEDPPPPPPAAAVRKALEGGREFLAEQQQDTASTSVPPPCTPLKEEDTTTTTTTFRNPPLLLLEALPPPPPPPPPPAATAIIDGSTTTTPSAGPLPVVDLSHHNSASSSSPSSSGDVCGRPQNYKATLNNGHPKGGKKLPSSNKHATRGDGSAAALSSASAGQACQADPRCLCVAHSHASLRQQFVWEWKTADYHLCYPTLNHRDWKQIFGESFFPTLFSPIFLLVLRISIAIANTAMLFYDGLTYYGNNETQIKKGTSPWVYLMYLTNWQWLLVCVHSLLMAAVGLGACCGWAKRPADLFSDALTANSNEDYTNENDDVNYHHGGGGDEKAGHLVLACPPPPPPCSSQFLRNWLPGYVQAREHSHSLFNVAAPPVPAFVRWWFFLDTSWEKMKAFGVLPPLSSVSQTASPPTAFCQINSCSICISAPQLQLASRCQRTTATDVQYCCCLKQRPIARLYRTKGVATLAEDTAEIDAPTPPLPKASAPFSSSSSSSKKKGRPHQLYVSTSSIARLPACPPPDICVTPWYVRMAFILNAVATVASTAVVILNWGVLVPTTPGHQDHDLLDYWKHLVGPLLLVINVFFSRLPFPAVMIIHDIVACAAYSFVTLLVYLLQIRNLKGQVGYVYALLDYGDKPVMASITLLCCMFLFLPSVHLLYWLALCRRNTYITPPPMVCCCSNKQRRITP